MKEKLRVYVVGFKNKTIVLVRAKNRQVASARAVRAAKQRYQDVVFKVGAPEIDPYKIGRDELRVVEPYLSDGRGFYVADVDRILCAWALRRGFWEESIPFVVAVTSIPMTPWFVPSPPKKSLQELIEFPPPPAAVRLAEPPKMLIDEISFKGNDEFAPITPAAELSLTSKIRRFFKTFLTK